MNVNLTHGVIDRIINDQEVNDVVVQLIGYKKVPGSNGPERFRLQISDGVTVSSMAMLGTQLNHLILNSQLEKFAVIRVDRYVCNKVSDKKIMMLLGVTVIAPGSEVGRKLGPPNSPNQSSFSISPTPNLAFKSQPSSSFNPLSFGSTLNNTNFTSAAEPPSTFNPLSIGNTPSSFVRKPPNYSPIKNEMGRMNQNGPPVNIYPISSLTPYQNKWTIRARVTLKQPLRNWSNSRGEGKVFSINLLDESGEIRATGFNELADKFHDFIETGKVYYISRGTLKPAKTSFNPLKNDYEMTFNSDTTITPCEDDSLSIPMLQFNFIPISQIQQIDKDALVDVIGICKSSSDISTVITRTTNREIKKREIVLVDQSNIDINLTLWDHEAETFDGSNSPIIALKGAKVSDFGGRSLSTNFNCVMQINPNIKEAHILQTWYQREGRHLESSSLSSKMGRSPFEGNWKSFAQAEAENLGTNDKPDYYSNKATVILVRKENCMYQSCPSDDCMKKVTDMNNGNYRCEKCAREFPNFKWRLLLSLNVADFSGNRWVTCFRESAEQILGMTSDELGLLKESDEDKFNDVIADANFKSFVFNYRVKMEVYNEENRLKTQVISVQPVDFVSYGKKILTDISGM